MQNEGMKVHSEKTAYRVIDMETYPRREHFAHFNAMPDATLMMTAKVNVTELVRFCRERKCSFYMAMTHLACLAANRVPQFRQRRRDGGIIEYETCGTSHIELRPDETYCYCDLRHDTDWDVFLPYCEAARKAALATPGLVENDDIDADYFISSVPWVHYEHLSMASGPDNPTISWGKYEEDFRGRLMMPVTVSVNHALVDGLHLGRFYTFLQEALDAPEKADEMRE